jgi:guanylate kinase
VQEGEMNKVQIEYLKLLGYKPSNEEGAILEHPDIENSMYGELTKYIWEGAKFKDVLLKHNWKLLKSTRNKIGRSIMREEVV